MISDDCTRKWKEDCDCNEIEIKLIGGKSKELNKKIFGQYLISSKTVSNRETYLSESGVYSVWYDAENGNWNIGLRNDTGSEKSMMYLNLKKSSNFDTKQTFAWNAKGTNLWNTISDEINVNVRCSSRIGNALSVSC